MDQKVANWQAYFQKTEQRPYRPLLETAVAADDSGCKVAIDCGCGTGNDTGYLLDQGYEVSRAIQPLGMRNTGIPLRFWPANYENTCMNKSALLILMSLLLTACDPTAPQVEQQQSTSGQSSVTQPPPNQPLQSRLYFQATVIFLDLEGGIYLLEDQNGNRYEPINLAEPYRQAGLQVAVSAEARPNQVSIGMAAPLIEIFNIERID